MLLLIFKIYQIAQVCLWSLCSSVLVSLWSLLIFFSVSMSAVITYVLHFWYVCGHYSCSSVLVCVRSLPMFFGVGMSVVITYVLQCWYVCGHYLCSSVLVCLWSLLIFFGTDWFEWPLAQIQVKFPWQLILIIQLTPYNSNPRFNSNLALLTRTKVDFPLISFMNTCTFTVILRSVSQTLDNLNLELTQSSFFLSDHLYMFHLFLNNHVNSLSVTGVQIQCPFLQALLLIIPFSKYQSISLAGVKVVCMILAFPPSVCLFSYFWLFASDHRQLKLAIT